MGREQNNSTAGRVPPPLRGRTTVGSLRKSEVVMTGCDEEPRMFQGVCELSVTKVPKPNDKPSHQSQCKRQESMLPCCVVMDLMSMVARQAAGPPSRKMKRCISCHNLIHQTSENEEITNRCSEHIVYPEEKVVEGRRDEKGHLNRSSTAWYLPQVTINIKHHEDAHA